jgi:hypothetical protein
MRKDLDFQLRNYIDSVQSFSFGMVVYKLNVLDGSPIFVTLSEDMTITVKWGHGPQVTYMNVSDAVDAVQDAYFYGFYALLA